MSDEEDEPELIAFMNEDETEYTVIIRRPGRPMSNSDVVLELEYFINQVSQADEAANRPGTHLH